ncbi:MAG: DUF5074 domain-containing protein [Muribaculaceae bacterium]|nr:DUF5074 domain-containing protein [Muribaculaceae bacterium]MDE7096474.1 DUF5074 domain-containing protein [Muribaculaceae bacterium]
MKKNLFISLLAIQLAAHAETDYTKGVFIVNEDWYGHQNSTVNYLIPDDPDGNYWEYRVIQKENPGVQLGCTNQFGAIWHDRFYFIAKQEKDPGASVAGGRITVADAKTMKVLYQSALIDPSGAQCDGRGFLGIDSHKGYISSSNGVWVFDLDTYTVKGMIEGTDNPNAGDDKPNTDPTGSLYYGQSGSMVMASGRVFLAHQQAGIIVIDPVNDSVSKVIDMNDVAEGAGIGSVIVAKDGSVWASVAKDTKGTGATLPYLLRVDPVTLSTEVITLESGVFAPSNSWYAWTPDTFCASSVTNTIYWSGGSNSWFTGKYVYKFDVDTRKASKIIDLDADGEKWKIYGCSMRVHPVTDELYVSLYREFSIPTYLTRRYDSNGNRLRDYSMISNYWFPSLPVFPQSASDDTGSAETLGENLDDPGSVYNLQGIILKTGIEYGEWGGLDSGIYIWKSKNKNKKFIVP